MELVYKTIWIVAVALPAYINGNFPSWAVTTVVIFLVFIIGDLVAIPFWTLFEKEPVSKTKAKATKAI
jgi:hypothetical protein